MISTVRVYYNTGLTVNNCLDSIAKLDVLFSYTDFNDIAIKQNRGLINIKINTNYSSIADGDYCKIDNIGYWITGIEMLNDNVAVLTLQQDYLTTVGIDNFTIISGWCTRRCVGYNEDALFSNVIPEDFTPSEELYIEDPHLIVGDEGSAKESFIVASIDLTWISRDAEKYDDPVSNSFVLVPEIEGVGSVITAYSLHPFANSTVLTNDIPVTCMYDPSVQRVQTGLKDARSLGLEGTIIASYAIPSFWINSKNVSTLGKVFNIDDNHGSLRSQYNLTWGSYKNNKVFSGQFQKITLYSNASKENKEFRVEDIIDSNNEAYYYYFADIRYNGCPFIRPRNFKNKTIGEGNKSFMGVIRGADWTNTPLFYNDNGSGFRIQRAIDTLNDSFQNLQYAFGGIASGLAMASGLKEGNVVSAGQGALELGKNIGGALTYNLHDMFSDNLQFSIPRPDLKFSMTPSIQDYIGNCFYELRTRLSDNDMTRFDNYLTMFGYAVSEPLQDNHLKTRQNFNYIKALDANIKTTYPLYMRAGIIEQILNGVRIWHVAPSNTALLNNPVVVPTP